MRPVLVLSVVFAAAAVILALGLPARAGDPPAEMPPSPRKVDQPFLTAALGEWAVTWTTTRPEGTRTGTSTSKWSLAVGGTAVVEDYASPDMLPGGFYGHSVMRASRDGKTLNVWWFDSMSEEPMRLTGPLTDTSATVEGETPMGRMKIVWTMVDGGFDFKGTIGEKAWFDQQYRRPK